MRGPALTAVLLAAAGCSLLDAAGSGDDDVDDGGGGCSDQDCFLVVDTGTDVDTPSLIAVGDVYGDSLPDAIVVDRNGDYLEVLENLGDGIFESKGTLEAGGSTWVAIGDFYSDDGNEVLALDPLDQRLLMVGISTENGGPYVINNTSTVDTTAALVAAGDFDGDQLDDVVVLYPALDPDGLHIMLNSGDGTFAPGDVFSPGFDSAPLVIGDIDNDGHPDVVTAHDGMVKVFRGQAGGDFEDYVIAGYFAQPLLSAAALDLTNDQLPELLVASGGGDSRVIFVRNLADGGIDDASLDEWLEDFDVVSDAVAGGDFDDDSATDVVAFNLDRTGDLPDAIIIRSLGGAGFDDSIQVYMDDPIGGGASGDFDGDGADDLLVAVPDAGVVRAFLSRLDAAQAAAISSP